MVKIGPQALGSPSKKVKPIMNSDAAIRRTGTITQLTRSGMGYLREAGSGRDFVFTFSRIDGYRGESLREMGLKAGSAVDFYCDGERVTSIVPN